MRAMSRSPAVACLWVLLGVVPAACRPEPPAAMAVAQGTPFSQDAGDERSGSTSDVKTDVTDDLGRDAATAFPQGDASLQPVEEVVLTDEVRRAGMSIIGEDLVFVFDAKRYGILTTPTEVSVRGSFNGWARKPEWMLQERTTEKGIWTLQKSLTDVDIPGNSGQPELRFVADEVWPTLPSDIEPGHSFLGNLLVITAGDDTRRIAQNEATAKAIKPLSSFDQSKPADLQTMANFRRVAGLSGLYRSYHPFKLSKTAPLLDTEAPRIATVKKLMVDEGIRSIVTVSGLEVPNPAAGESISAYQQAIIDAGHSLVISTEYNTVYFASDGAAFGQALKAVVGFIIDTKTLTPVLLHCRLGTDRTGMFVATLAALSGTPWSEIVADYQRSNDVGMGEFRDHELLAYAFRRIVGVAPDSVPDLQAAMSAHFITAGYLTDAQIKSLAAKLR